MQTSARAESDTCSETRPPVGQNVGLVSAGIAATVWRILATRDQLATVVAVYGRG